MELSDEQIKKFRQGDILVFEKVHVNMYQSLCLFGGKIVAEYDVVNDTVHEAFIALWDKKEELDNIYRIKSYLYTIVKNKLLTYKRLKKTVSFDDMQLDVEEDDLDMQVLKEELYKGVRDAVSELPERTRKVINLKLGGHTNNEIAEQLDISVNTVKTLQKAGYSKLREKLKNNAYMLLILAELIK